MFYRLAEKNSWMKYILGIFLVYLFFPVVVKGQGSGLILDCAKEANVQEGYCNNINALIKQGIIIGDYLLGIAGSLALVAFIYGGTMMLISFGNSDRFKQGQKALVAAVVGLVISFGAYVIIGFVLDAVGVSQDFRAIN